jgi:phosphoglycolate phosphatase
MNTMLRKRNLPLLSLKKYKEVFTFPVRDYYEKIGYNFTKEKWEDVAIEFIELYLAGLPQCRLADQAEKLLCHFHNAGLNQVILSAMHQEKLNSSIDNFNIRQYFSYTLGITNHYAESKTANAHYLLKILQTNPKEVCLIGDTLHDFEVARVVGIKSILVSYGHQSAKKLHSSGTHVVNTLSSLIQMINHDGR